VEVPTSEIRGEAAVRRCGCFCFALNAYWRLHGVGIILWANSWYDEVHSHSHSHCSIDTNHIMSCRIISYHIISYHNHIRLRVCSVWCAIISISYHIRFEFECECPVPVYPEPNRLFWTVMTHSGCNVVYLFCVYENDHGVHWLSRYDHNLFIVKCNVFVIVRHLVCWTRWGCWAHLSSFDLLSLYLFYMKYVIK